MKWLVSCRPDIIDSVRFEAPLHMTRIFNYTIDPHCRLDACRTAFKRRFIQSQGLSWRPVTVSSHCHWICAAQEKHKEAF